MRTFDKKIWTQLGHYLRPFYGLFLETLILSIVLELLKIVPNYVFARIIDQFVTVASGNQVNTFQNILLLSGAFLLGSWMAHITEYFRDRRVQHAHPVIYEYLIGLANKKILSLSLKYHEDHNPSASTVKIHKGIWSTIELLFALNDEVLPSAFQIALSFIIIVYLDWRSGLVYLVVVPLYLYYSIKIFKQVQPYRDRFHAKDGEIYKSLGQSFGLIRTVQDFAQEEKQERTVRQLVREFGDIWHKRGHFEEVRAFWRDGLLLVARVGTMLFYAYATIKGILSPGLLVFFVTITERSYVALNRAGRVLRRITDKIDHLTELMQLLNEKEDITDVPNAVILGPVEGKIKFQDATFSYHSSSQEVLQDVSFTVNPRDMVAIVGHSGSGKSTIIKVLYRHYDLISGSIKIDDVDIRTVTRRSLREKMAIVSQDIDIFDASVMDNIRYSNPNASLEEVETAAKIAYAHDFIMKFDNGYETLVGERGVRLSGGQKQRIGIARAVLAKPSILIFDEATSSLDTESERLIQQAMYEIAKNCTMLVIAHRLSTIQHADKIIVMENGKISESGTHDELMKAGGVFARMRTLQQLGEIRE